MYPCYVGGAPVTQWVKRWPTDLADRVQSSLEMKSSQPNRKRSSISHSLSLSLKHRPDMIEILLKKDVKLQVIHPSIVM